MEIKLSHGINAKLLSFSKDFSSKVIYPSHIRSLKRARPTAKRVVVCSIIDELNATKLSVKEMIRMKIMDKSLHVFVDDKGMPLSAFKPREQSRKKKRAGVVVQIKKKGGKQVLKNAFIANNSKGNKAVFERVGGSRLPVKELYTSRPADIARNHSVQKEIISKVDEKYSREFKHNIEFYRDRYVDQLKKGFK